MIIHFTLFHVNQNAKVRQSCCGVFLFHSFRISSIGVTSNENVFLSGIQMCQNRTIIEGRIDAFVMFFFFFRINIFTSSWVSRSIGEDNPSMPFVQIRIASHWHEIWFKRITFIQLNRISLYDVQLFEHLQSNFSSAFWIILLLLICKELVISTGSKLL